MASDSYLVIDGVKGESTDADFKDSIEIISFSHAISQPASATANSAGGATTGRCKHEDFVITKYVDLSSPKLYELCSSGKHVKNVKLTLNRASGDKRVAYLTIEMDQALVSKVTSDSSKEHDLPTETVSFNYSVIKWTYTQQKRTDGSGGGKMATGWSLSENKTAA